MDYLYEEALKYGYDVYKQPFTEMYTATISIKGSLDGVKLELGSFRGSPSTSGAITAPLVAVSNLGCSAVITLSISSSPCSQTPANHVYIC